MREKIKDTGGAFDGWGGKGEKSENLRGGGRQTKEISVQGEI